MVSEGKVSVTDTDTNSITNVRIVKPILFLCQLIFIMYVKASDKEEE